MLSFRPIDKHSIVNEISIFLKKWQHRNCTYTPSVLFMWGDLMGAEYCIEENVFYFKSIYQKETSLFGMPIGAAPDLTIPKVLEYAQKNGFEPIFYMPESALSELSKYYDFTAKKNELYFDYIYNAEDLIALKGKKYHAKRNYINRFIRENPNHEFKALTKEQVPYVKEFLMDFFENIKEDCKEFTTFEKYEKCRAVKVLDNYEDLGLFGGVLYVDGKVIGFTIGDIIGDTLFVHIEKASREIVGSFEYINNAFAKAHAQGLNYINREDDAGSEGLKKAKESYNPVLKLYNYRAKIIKPRAK